MYKVLIQTNEYFSRVAWELALSKYLPEYNSLLSISYVSNGAEIKNQINNSDICFCLKLPNDTHLSELKVKLLYHGISDIDYLIQTDLPEAIELYSSKGIASSIIAEYCLMTALNLIRNFHVAIVNKEKKKWDQSLFLSSNTNSISDYKIGVLGLGANGSAIVSLFSSLGCQVAGYSKTPKEKLNLIKWFSSTQLNEILEFSDILILSLPLRPETVNLISKNQLEILGKDSYLINVARGVIVHEQDLIFALKNNTIKAAAIDVTNIEPLSRRSKLWNLNNLLITPHIAGNINSVFEKIQCNFIERLITYIDSNNKDKRLK